MILANLILEVLALLNGLLVHFVDTPGATFTQGTDGEWTAAGLSVPGLTAKGNSLMGAVADILVYGATLVDFIVQVLVGQSVAGSP
jgi:hypothetical protein